MQTHLCRAAALVAVLLTLATGSQHVDAADGGASTMPLTKDDVLSVRDGRFYLDGRPFAEISFNKFDLLWQLYDQLAAGNALDDANPLVQAQDTALRNLHEMGFRTIRFFALPWGPRGPESYADPEKRKHLYAALDKALELCDRHDIRVVWSLGAGSFTDTKLVRGKGWVYGEEQKRELISDPESRGRKLLYQYIDETVTRYKRRRAVLMWEISNEVTLSADIGNKDRVWQGQRMPTLEDVAGFFDDVAKRIKAADPLRLGNSGGSHMREHQWHLYQREGWVRDTFEEQFKCFELLYADSAVDVIDIHSYPNNKGGYVIMGEDGEETLLGDGGHMAIAARLGRPLMIGELGLHAAARTKKKVWEETPDYFETYADTAAAMPWVERTLNSVIDAGVQLSYWWCYQSDRRMDQNKPQRFDLTRERNPELLACFVEANRRLKAKLGGSASARRPPLLAAYYTWYRTGDHPRFPWSNWTRDEAAANAPAKAAQRPGEPPLSSAAYPLIGLYDSADPKVAEWHVQLAQAAGIDGFLVSWWEAFKQRDKAFETGVLAAAEKRGFKVALLDERAQYHTDFAWYKESVVRALGKYKDSPAYLRIDGKPVLYLYQVARNATLTPAKFAELKQHVESEIGAVYWIVDKIAHDHQAQRAGTPDRIKRIPQEWLDAPGIDAFAFYSVFSNFRAHRYEDLSGKFRYLTQLAHDAGKQMLLPVHPGHDNSHFRTDPYVMPRREGQTLRDYLRAATEAGADFIMVTSWNEWPETTVVEPSSTWPDPYHYLRILAEWRGRDFVPPPSLPRRPAHATPRR